MEYSMETFCYRLTQVHLEKAIKMEKDSKRSVIFDTFDLSAVKTLKYVIKGVPSLVTLASL